MGEKIHGGGGLKRIRLIERRRNREKKFENRRAGEKIGEGRNRHSLDPPRNGGGSDEREEREGTEKNILTENEEWSENSES